MTPAVRGRQRIPRPQRWHQGEPAPWAEDAHAESVSVARVEESLSAYEPVEIVRGPAVERPARRGPQSAVLVTLFDDPDDGAMTILTRRPDHMRKHAGEVAFPGGAADATDPTLWHTAVREAHEEIDLDPNLPRPIGALDRFVTGASYSLVAPLVAALDDRPSLRPSPDEVDEILFVPLGTLMHPDVYRSELWEWEGELRAMHFFELDGDTVWGATALMLHRLLEIAMV